MTINGPLSNDNVEVLDLLSGGLSEIEPIPSSALRQAYGACQMAAMSIELAELIFDSSAVKQPAMRRGNEKESRFLRFTNDNITLDLSLLADGTTIMGEIDPLVAPELLFEDRDNTSISIPVDQFGRFRLSSEAQTFRLRVIDHLVTQWISR